MKIGRKTIFRPPKKHNLLIVLVGRSGAGKNSFVKAMELEDYQYEITGRIKRQLKEKGQSVNHETIQPIMHRLYGENPYWQIPQILNELREKGFLIVNGSRSFLEIEKLIKSCPLALVVEIRANALARRKRLGLRDGTSKLEFKKIESDEMKVTPLAKILQDDFVDVVITNNGSLEALEKKAKNFALLLSSLKGV